MRIEGGGKKRGEGERRYRVIERRKVRRKEGRKRGREGVKVVGRGGTCCPQCVYPASGPVERVTLLTAGVRTDPLKSTVNQPANPIVVD